MAAPRRRRGRWLIAGGLVGAALAPPVAPLRRAALERALRLRATLSDPLAAFMEAPCHREVFDSDAEDTVIHVTIGPRS